MKFCSKCKSKKDADKFYDNQGWCIECHLGYYKAKNYSMQGKPKQIREESEKGKRICSRCREERLLENYPKNKSCKLGRERTCKPCIYSRRDKEKQAKLTKRWYVKNREAILAKEKIKYRENIEERRAYGRKHQRENPAIYKAAKHRRRKRSIENGNNDLTAGQIKKVLADAVCVYCGCKENMTIDHIIPIARGGQNTLNNICAACFSCNTDKRTMTAEEFLKVNYE